jgi:hypothetical protein
MFRVVSAAIAQDLADARLRFPSDDLLLGVLYARAGIMDEASDRLASYTSAHPESAQARRLAAEVAAWKIARQ